MSIGKDILAGFGFGFYWKSTLVLTDMPPGDAAAASRPSGASSDGHSAVGAVAAADRGVVLRHT